MSQVGIVYVISKMDDSLHPKSCERGRFRVAKFPNRIARLIHQMWDKMVTMIVIKNDNRTMTTFEGAQIDVEGSSMIWASKTQKKAIIEKNREKKLTTLS